MKIEDLEVWRNDSVLAGHFFTAQAITQFITQLLKETQDATDIAVDVQPLRPDVDGSQAR